MKLVFKHYPTGITYSKQVKNLETGYNEMMDIVEAKELSFVSFYSKECNSQVAFPAAFVKECLLFLVPETEQDKLEFAEIV